MEAVSPLRRPSLLPVYIAEACQTGGRGLFAIALVNYLLFERGFGTGETGAISAFYNLGFLAFTFVAGRAIDRIGRERLLEIVTVVVFACSAYYLLPIERGASLAVFVVIRTVDGGATGIFWSAVQSYAKKLAEIDQASRNSFTSKYNFSWNAGVIIGTVAGWAMTAGTSTNVLGFYLSVAIAGVQLVAILSLRLAGTPKQRDPNENNGQDGPVPRPLTAEERRTISSIPAVLVLFSLLTHSFTTGGLSIYLPAKIKALSLASFVSYVFFFEQAVAQTASMTAGGKLKEQHVVPAILAGPAVICTGWLLLGISAEGVLMSAGILVQSFMQGILYAAGMRFLTGVSQATGKAGLFSRFQFVMGFGRMIGPLAFGFMIEAGLDVAVAVTIVFDLSVFAALMVAFKARRAPSPLAAPRPSSYAPAR
ncbi:MAG: MFS transporter [Candidatus Lokiarchaeota archaeon]|nr:MFS transporter [Candidatus Lokiarchaeota archaeon]